MAEVANRKTEISERFLNFIDTHLQNLLNGKEEKMLELNEIATELGISHKYLIEIFNELHQHHPCYFYVEKIITVSKDLIANTNQPISAIAQLLTYDPSNFNKFFKKEVGITPGEYRKQAKS